MTVLAVMFLFASLMAQWIKNLSALKETQETQVQSPSQEYPLEEEMATHSSILVIKVSLESISEKAMAPHSSTLAWKIPWTEEPGRLQSMGSLRVGHD